MTEFGQVGLDTGDPGTGMSSGQMWKDSTDVYVEGIQIGPIDNPIIVELLSRHFSVSPDAVHTYWCVELCMQKIPVNFKFSKNINSFKHVEMLNAVNLTAHICVKSY